MGKKNESMAKPRELPSQVDVDFVKIPLLPTKLPPGLTKASLAEIAPIAVIPIPRKVLRGEDPTRARAVEVLGDSMIGAGLVDGDVVIFLIDEIHGNGIYVLKIEDKLAVKRVVFDSIPGKLQLISENPRYSDQVESADGQTIEVVGKVYGWVHAHPH